MVEGIKPNGGSGDTKTGVPNLLNSFDNLACMWVVWIEYGEWRMNNAYVYNFTGFSYTVHHVQ